MSYTVKSSFVTTWLRDISSWPNELHDKMHFVTSVCVKRYVARHEHMSRSYSSKSRSYRLYRTCVCHEYICPEHPTPRRDSMYDTSTRGSNTGQKSFRRSSASRVSFALKTQFSCTLFLIEIDDHVSNCSLEALPNCLNLHFRVRFRVINEKLKNENF